MMTRGTPGKASRVGATEAGAAPGEFELIETLFAPLARGAAGAIGLADDAALVAAVPGTEIVVTCDAAVEGVHFPAGEAPDLIGRKLLRVNLSDLAAMGARPVGYLVALMLPASHGAQWAEGFAKGLAKDQATYDVTLLGGDTVRTPGPLSAALTALGRVGEGAALLRSGAAPGDGVYVSGTIGDGALGLRIVAGETGVGSPDDRDHLIRRLQLPEPRVDLGVRLAGVATAAVDVSDGLLADLGHVCRASGVGAAVQLDAVPLSAPAARMVEAGAAAKADLIAAGDDYELLFTAPEARGRELAALAGELDLPLTRIGSIVADRGVEVLGPDGTPLKIARRGYTHF